MRTVFLGTSEFAVAILEKLTASDHRPDLIITRPDRPAGRGRRLTSPPVFTASGRLGLKVIQPDNLHEQQIIDQIDAVEPEALCVCAYGVLIKEPLLSKYPIVNVHPSLLPRWRGAAPIERALMAGDTETGVSIIKLTAGLDSGPIYASEKLPIKPYENYGSLSEALAYVGGQLLVKVLDDIPVPREQDDAGVTYAEKIGPEDRLINPQRPARELVDQVRALAPHIGARLRLTDDSFLGIWGAKEMEGGGEVGQFGTQNEMLVLHTADGDLRLIRIQPPGKNIMFAEDWMRGKPGALKAAAAESNIDLWAGGDS